MKELNYVVQTAHHQGKKITVKRDFYNNNNDILIKFEIQTKFALFSFKMHFIDYNKILHTCKISLWLVEYILN